MSGISSRAPGGIQNRYLFNGKEKQANEFSDGSCLELYDYGARLQDPQLGRWFAPDPLAEKYFSTTPYNFVLNNPISFVDIDGMDVYLLKSDGTVILAKKEDKSDILYAIDKSDQIEDTNGDKKTDEKDGVTIDTKGVIGQLAGYRKGAPYLMYQTIAEESQKNEDNLLKLFHYVSNNSEAEFTLAYFKYNENDYISLQTYRKPYVGRDFSPGPSALGLKDSDIKKIYHNHTNNINYNSSWTERNSMGEDAKGKVSGGDYLNAVIGKRTYPDYVYFPKSTNLYNVTQIGINFIQKINNDYKRLKK